MHKIVSPSEGIFLHVKHFRNLVKFISENVLFETSAWHIVFIIFKSQGHMRNFTEIIDCVWFWFSSQEIPKSKSTESC